MSASLALVEAPGEAEDDHRLIPPGEYVAAYVRHQAVAMRMFRGSFKVFVWFRIVDPGPAFEIELYRAYRVKSLTPFQACQAE